MGEKDERGGSLSKRGKTNGLERSGGRRHRAVPKVHTMSWFVYRENFASTEPSQSGIEKINRFGGGKRALNIWTIHPGAFGKSDRKRLDRSYGGGATTNGVGDWHDQSEKKNLFRESYWEGHPNTCQRRTKATAWEGGLCDGSRSLTPKTSKKPFRLSTKRGVMAIGSELLVKYLGPNFIGA